MTPPEYMTPEQFAEIVRTNKPYLLELENNFQSVAYGEVDVKFTIRSGEVMKMSFYNAKTWLSPKTK